MNKLIKKLSPITELILVLIIGFGLFIYSSTCSFFIVNSDYTHSWMYKITSQSEYLVVIQEVISFLIIFYILKVRGWKLTDFNLTFTFRMIWIALLIMFIRNIIGNIGYKILDAFKIVDEKIVKHVHFVL